MSFWDDNWQLSYVFHSWICTMTGDGCHTGVIISPSHVTAVLGEAAMSEWRASFWDDGRLSGVPVAFLG